jgi:flagellar basal-body rod modification protein FlgD
MATIAPTSSTSSAALTNPTSNLNLQDFMKILLTQLTYQDPLKPMDNEQFMSQIAQFTTLEQTQQLNDKIDQLLAVQSVTQSIGLLGKTVDVNATSGPLSGTVSAIALSSSGSPQLTVHTTSGDVAGITLSQVVSVHN